MNAKELVRRLEKGEVVSMDPKDWEALAPGFEEIGRHDTTIAGDLVLVRTPAGPAAVERPAPDRLVMRAFTDEDVMRRFVAERMELYERMWDGCGCKIDYDA